MIQSLSLLQSFVHLTQCAMKLIMGVPGVYLKEVTKADGLLFVDSFCCNYFPCSHCHFLLLLWHIPLHTPTVRFRSWGSVVVKAMRY